MFSEIYLSKSLISTMCDLWQASCRKMFSSDVLLLNAFGELVDKELEVCGYLYFYIIYGFENLT